MKRNRIRRWTLILIVSILFVGFSPSVAANSTILHDLRYEVQLQEDGSGHVRETRVMSIEEGTENFFEHEGLTRDDIRDFIVYADGEPMDWQEEWDSTRSQAEKAHEYGMLDTVNGVEFVWGIPEYGEVTYELHYTIEEMVFQLEDGQSMNWRFFAGDGSLMPQQMSLTVEAPEDLDAENTNLALLGLADADWVLTDGRFEAEKTTSLSAGEDIILLLQFEEEIFSNLNTLNQTLAEQEAIALEGSSVEESSNGSAERAREIYSEREERQAQSRFLWRLFIGIGVFGFVIPRLLYLKMKSQTLRREGHIHHKHVQKDVKRRNEGKISAEIPYEWDATTLAYLLRARQAGNFEDYYLSYFIRWAKEGLIEMEERTVGKINRRRETVIHIHRRKGDDLTGIEERFWTILYRAKGSDDVLYQGAMERYCKEFPHTMKKLNRQISRFSEDYLKREGYIKEESINILGIFPADVVKLTSKGEALMDRIQQFENFVQLVEERKVPKEEVAAIEDWDEFMRWSCLLGYGEELVDKLKQHFPGIWEDVLDHYPYHMYHHSYQSYRENIRRGYNHGTSSGFTGSGSAGGSFSGGGGGSMGGGSSGVR